MKIYWSRRRPTPYENLAAVFMSQARPVQSDIRSVFKTMVYQALE